MRSQAHRMTNAGKTLLPLAESDQAQPRQPQRRAASAPAPPASDSPRGVRVPLGINAHISPSRAGLTGGSQRARVFQVAEEQGENMGKDNKKHRRDCFRRWMMGRVAKRYCRKMSKACCRVPYCRDCELVKDGRDCRGNPVGTLEAVMAEAVHTRTRPLLLPGEGPP